MLMTMVAWQPCRSMCGPRAWHLGFDHLILRVSRGSGGRAAGGQDRLQDVRLLRTSLRDNIRLTRPDATDEDVELVARAAQIHDRILRFERGYDAVVGIDANLSGGEAQRVTIARALLANAPILVHHQPPGGDSV